jgi:WD40 repeat protein
LEDKFINEQYKNWKVNSRFLYDVCLSHALEWPSLTVQMLPTPEGTDSKSEKERRLLLGTLTSDNEQNYVLVVKVVMPGDDYEEDEAQEPATGENWQREAPNKGPKARVEILKRINHQGEVNRARYMPQKTAMFATKGPGGEVLVFDETKQPAKPPTDGACTPLLKLTGHTKEGYGVCWNSLTAGRIVSGSDDATICTWDAEATHANSQAVEPLATYKGHTSVVEDVAWHTSSPSIFASVGDDKQLLIWDELVPVRNPVQSVSGHSGEINCISFNPFNQHLLATGSADKTVALWDRRNMDAKLHSFAVHDDEISQVQWSASYATILASSSADRKIAVLDVSRIGTEQTKEEAEDGPPELLFQHGGHTSKVSDLCWSPNPQDPWLVASVADNNMLQIWQMASHIYKEDSAGPDIPAGRIE